MQHVALLFAILLSLYRLITDNVSMFPFNNLKDTTDKERGFEMLLKYPPLLLLIFTLIFRDPVTSFIGVMIISIICIYHFVEWWHPYLFGHQSPKECEVYLRKYAGTHTFYPRIKDHPVPNTLQTIMGFLILFTAIFTILNFHNIMK